MAISRYQMYMPYRSIVGERNPSNRAHSEGHLASNELCSKTSKTKRGKGRSKFQENGKYQQKKGQEIYNA